MSFEPVSFTTQLLGTLIGAGVGFALVVRWDRKKKKTEREETKNMIIDSLVEEMQKNLDGANQFKMPTWDKNDGQFKGEFGLAATSAFQSIVSGGNFLVLPINAQTGVSEIYQHCELFNKFMNDIIDFTSFHLADDQRSKATTELTGRLREQQKALQTTIPDSIKELKSLKKEKK